MTLHRMHRHGEERPARRRLRRGAARAVALGVLGLMLVSSAPSADGAMRILVDGSASMDGFFGEGLGPLLEDVAAAFQAAAPSITYFVSSEDSDDPQRLQLYSRLSDMPGTSERQHTRLDHAFLRGVQAAKSAPSILVIVTDNVQEATRPHITTATFLELLQAERIDGLFVMPTPVLFNGDIAFAKRDYESEQAWTTAVQAFTPTAEIRRATQTYFHAGYQGDRELMVYVFLLRGDGSSGGASADEVRASYLRGLSRLHNTGKTVLRIKPIDGRAFTIHGVREPSQWLSLVKQPATEEPRLATHMEMYIRPDPSASGVDQQGGGEDAHAPRVLLSLVDNSIVGGPQPNAFRYTDGASLRFHFALASRLHHINVGCPKPAGEATGGDPLFLRTEVRFELANAVFSAPRAGLAVPTADDQETGASVVARGAVYPGTLQNVLTGPADVGEVKAPTDTDPFYESWVTISPVRRRPGVWNALWAFFAESADAGLDFDIKMVVPVECLTLNPVAQARHFTAERTDVARVYMPRGRDLVQMLSSGPATVHLHAKLDDGVRVKTGSAVGYVGLVALVGAAFAGGVTLRRRRRRA